MNVKLLIDAIIRDTTVLIAQLATSAGVRAPLSHVANQVFLDLVSELESQGVGRKVVADMFGLALRSYQLKVQRLSASAAEENRTLWEAVLAYVEDSDVVSRDDVLHRFRYDDEAMVRGILRDLVESGLVFRTGRGDTTSYRATTDLDLTDAPSDQQNAASVVWITIYRRGPISEAELAAALALKPKVIAEAVRDLLADGRIRTEEPVDNTADDVLYLCDDCVIPVGASVGWEASVLDHFQSMVRAICVKLRNGKTKTHPDDLLGGSTYSFDVWDGHPFKDEALSLLGVIRGQAPLLRDKIAEYNEQHKPPANGQFKVTFYCGQSVVGADDEPGIPGHEG